MLQIFPKMFSIFSHIAGKATQFAEKSCVQLPLYFPGKCPSFSLIFLEKSSNCTAIFPNSLNSGETFSIPKREQQRRKNSGKSVENSQPFPFDETHSHRNEFHRLEMFIFAPGKTWSIFFPGHMSPRTRSHLSKPIQQLLKSNHIYRP